MSVIHVVDVVGEGVVGATSSAAAVVVVVAIVLITSIPPAITTIAAMLTIAATSTSTAGNFVPRPSPAFPMVGWWIGRGRARLVPHFYRQVPAAAKQTTRNRATHDQYSEGCFPALCWY